MAIQRTSLADVPKDIEEEVFFLYKIGVGIDEIEYVISKKLKCSQTKT